MYHFQGSREHIPPGGLNDILERKILSGNTNIFSTSNLVLRCGSGRTKSAHGRTGGRNGRMDDVKTISFRLRLGITIPVLRVT